MKTGVLLTLLLSCSNAALSSEIVVLTDGTRMEKGTDLIMPGKWNPGRSP